MKLESARIEKIRKGLLALIPFAYATALSPSISASLFWADDGVTFTFIRRIPSFWRLFGSDVFQLFRPIKNLIWFGFEKLHPFGLEWCHLIAIVIGAISFFPLLFLFDRIFATRWKALAAAAVWLFAPTLASSAAWLSCVNVRIMVVFAALAITNHDKAFEAGTFRSWRAVLAGLFLFLSLVSYECAVAVVPILFLFDLQLRPGRLQLNTARMAHIGYWAIALLYLILRFLASGKTHAGWWINAERWQLVVSSPYFTVKHFLCWFWPFGKFTVLGSYRWGDAPGWILAVCAVLGIGVLLFALLCWKRLSVLSFCILFAAIGFAPVSNCLGFGNGPYGDYYLALASVGIAAGCVESCCLLLKLPERWCRIPSIAIVVVFILTRVVAGFETVRWAKFWGQGDLAFAESIRNHPEFHSNKYAYIRFLSYENRYEEALELGRQIEASVVGSSFRMGAVNLVRALYAINISHDADEAFRYIDLCEQNLGYDMTTNLCQFYRGCVFEDLLEDTDEAESQYNAALADGIEFELVPCVDRLARLKAIRGERNEAISLWERASELDTGNVTVLWNLSAAYRDAGEMEKSERMWKRVQMLTGGVP